jgi:hypothetical protein
MTAARRVAPLATRPGCRRPSAGSVRSRGHAYARLAPCSGTSVIYETLDEMLRTDRTQSVSGRCIKWGLSKFLEIRRGEVISDTTNNVRWSSDGA